MTRNERVRLAETVRRACLAAAREAYEEGGMQGLCHEGRFELALGAIAQLDLAEHSESPASDD